MATPEARRATSADLPAMSATLAAAFHDDPVMAWLFGTDPAKVLPRLRRFFHLEGAQYLRHSWVFTVDGHAGAALWAPPGRWRATARDLLRMAPFMTVAMRHRVPRALRGLGMIEKAHHRFPDHYYLSVLGTHPDHQGTGVASRVLRPVLDHCDEQGVGAYLESSKERNIPFYRRHGFEVADELHLPGGPPLWPMWRDPQGPSTVR